MVQSGVLGTVATGRTTVSCRYDIRERFLERSARHRPVVGRSHQTPCLDLAEPSGVRTQEQDQNRTRYAFSLIIHRLFCSPYSVNEKYILRTIFKTQHKRIFG